MPESVKHVIRFPLGLYAKIRKLAQVEHRSINSQVLSMLEQFVADYERRHGVIKPDDD